MHQSGGNEAVRPPVPPFNEETAKQKVKAAQDTWNARDPERCRWYTRRTRSGATETSSSRGAEIVAFLKRKWARELDYRLEKNLWCSTQNRIAVRFEYESRDAEGQWWRSHGNGQ